MLGALVYIKMNMITESFYKVLTIMYMQEGLDASNINTIKTTNNDHECIIQTEAYASADQGHSRWYLS